MISDSQTISPTNYNLTEKVFAAGDADGVQEEDENELMVKEGIPECPEVIDIEDVKGTEHAADQDHD